MQCIELKRNKDDSKSAIKNNFESEEVWELGFPNPSVSITKNERFSYYGFFAWKTLVSKTRPLVQAWTEFPTWKIWFSRIH